jgi:flagellar motor switch protein FliN/FliY
MSSENLSQAEIEALMAQAGGADPTAASPAASDVPAGIDDLQQVANAAAAGLDAKFQAAPTLKPPPAPAPPASGAAAPAAPKTIGAAIPGTGAPQSFSTPTVTPTAAKPPPGALELLDDVELDVRIELGRTQMYIEDVLRLGVDSVVELDKLAGDPVDIYVNDRLIARGEVLVLNDNFCVRINDILSPVPELAGDA